MNTIAQETPASPAAQQVALQATLSLVARLLLAALFVLAGINKIGAMEGTVGYISSVGLPLPEVVYFGTVALEIGGGLLLAAGFKARQVALAMGVFTVLTAVIFHNDFSQQIEMTMFLKNLAIAGGMFAIAAFGAGRYSVDRG
ncbi:MAG: DoxX family protein [Pseudomonadota bacterium]